MIDREAQNRGEQGGGSPTGDADLDAIESRVVWIYGSPRSGSTWLTEQLCDPLELDKTNPAGFAARSGATEPAAVLPVNEFLVSTHVDPPPSDPLELEPAGPGDPAEGLLAAGFESAWRPPLRRLILTRLAAVETVARAAGTAVAAEPAFAVKEVNGSHAAATVMALFPRSRMLFLVRDGRDVLDSRLHAVGKGGWMTGTHRRRRFETPTERLEWARGALREWSHGVGQSGRAYDGHAPERRLLIRYEELVAETAPTIAGAFRWLGLEKAPEQVERIVARHSFSAVDSEERGATRKRRAARPGLWRENLSADELAAADELIGAQLAGLGYER